MKKWESNKVKFMDKGIECKFNTLSMVLIFIGILFLLSFIPLKVLKATEYKTDEYIKAWRIKGEEFFLVEHTHSVQLTTVSEKYEIQGEDIILVESNFGTFGAGLPATTPYKLELTEKGFRVYDINEKMDYLVYRAGAVKANHRLIYEGVRYDFLDFTEPQTGVRFRVDKMPYFIFIIREGLN